MVDTLTGNDPVDTNTGINTGGANPDTSVAEPSVVDFDENQLVRIKGIDKPVKIGEHVRGFQAQFTRASQRAAELERKLQERESQLSRFEQERQAAAQRQGQGQQGPDIYEQLRQLPYLDGQTAVAVVQAIGQEIKQRDMITLAALKEIHNLKGIVSKLHESAGMSSFDAKINRWLQDGGYPPEYADLAKEIYLAYEGDDLDAEFPQIFAQRVEQIRKVEEARRAAQVAAARKTPFVPGRGGQGGPTKPLEIPANANPAKVAEMLFDAMNQSGT